MTNQPQRESAGVRSIEDILASAPSPAPLQAAKGEILSAGVSEGVVSLKRAVHHLEDFPNDPFSLGEMERIVDRAVRDCWDRYEARDLKSEAFTEWFEGFWAWVETYSGQMCDRAKEKLVPLREHLRARPGGYHLSRRELDARLVQATTALSKVTAERDELRRLMITLIGSPAQREAQPQAVPAPTLPHVSMRTAASAGGRSSVRRDVALAPLQGRANQDADDFFVSLKSKRLGARLKQSFLAVLEIKNEDQRSGYADRKAYMRKVAGRVATGYTYQGLLNLWSRHKVYPEFEEGGQSGARYLQWFVERLAIQCSNAGLLDEL